VVGTRKTGSPPLQMVRQTVQTYGRLLAYERDFVHSRGIAQGICQALKEHVRDFHHLGFGPGC